ncbi:MAG: deoxyribodipyrimidine photo-lyase [Acidobacteria bacterium]|nr:deoxyribodipyrimidine photo-lyase [Acidobacteriota bacterium]
MIHDQRLHRRNQRQVQNGRFVLYWMQRSQRATWNHALEYAIRQANERQLPVVVYFGLTPDYPRANLRHYTFMLQGLQETARQLSERGIRFILRTESPPQGIVPLAGEAALVVVDGAWLTRLRRWRQAVAQRLACPLIEVETDCVVPVTAASPKEEYAAATLRPKIHKVLDHFLQPLEEREPRHSSLAMDMKSVSLTDIAGLLSRLGIDASVGPVAAFQGGPAAAGRQMRRFLQERLDRYPDERNDPNRDAVSHLSPYLHFGHISPLHVALQVKATGSPGADDFLEELIIRRELSLNFVWYNPAPETLEGLPGWCRRTLQEHAADEREHMYTPAEFEAGRTHDPYWNAAQREMVLTGKMHGYMRMYWGKKILEWSPSPAEAMALAIRLNDQYELDGRDANGYTGVAWCLGKHDRPWKERPVFGKIRYMNANGLRRKFDADAYVARIKEIESAHGREG